jgi:4-hydroxybenzoate polyprenyltransferase
LAAAGRILWEVLVFRLRKLEMANLAGAVALMLVLRLPLTDAAVRTLFGVLLNLLVYLNNDYLDVAIDATAPDKDADKVRFLREHMGAARAAQLGLVLTLVAIALLHAPGLLLPLIAGGGVCWLYSAKLKHTPLLDVVAMAAWGVLMPLCGSPLENSLGLALAFQLGCFSSVFEPIQVMRDHDADLAQGVRTTAVALGLPATLRLCRALMLICALYAALVIHPVAGGVCAIAIFVPMRRNRVEQYWTTVKLVYGIAFLIACASAYVDGHTRGLLFLVGESGMIPSETLQ